MLIMSVFRKPGKAASLLAKMFNEQSGRGGDMAGSVRESAASKRVNGKKEVTIWPETKDRLLPCYWY